MKQPKILFVGYGIIGKYESLQISPLPFDIYDLNYVSPNYSDDTVYDFTFIAVPTPTVDGRCDTSIVEQAIKEHKSNIFIIKSTVYPGFTKDMLLKYPDKHIIFSPEHYGATSHAKNFEYNFTVLGGNKEDCLKVQQLLQRVYDARHKFMIVDSTTAELSKYMINSYLAMKVNFCNAFWEISNSLNINYETLRECFILDPRVNPAHTYVYADAPYWDSHCFNKDLPAIASMSKNQLLYAICEYNDMLKGKYKSIML